MIALTVTLMILTVVSVSLIGLMRTDMTHASIQNAVARSFYIAQAGLAEARVQVSAAADPVAFTTPERGVTAPYGGGRFTYWVDAGPAAGCGPGLKTLESQGEVELLGRTMGSRVRACAVGGTPLLAALFGVGRVEFLGSSRTYLAPYEIGTPGGGGTLGSFTEINFAGGGVHLNAVSEITTETVTVREGTFPDYALFGFSMAPEYDPTPTVDPAPWILAAFGDLLKARPTSGPMPNPCGTPYACVTVGDIVTDIPGVSDLREANYLTHVYLKRFKEETVPSLLLDAGVFRTLAEQNGANAALNERAALPGKRDSLYRFGEMFRILSYMAQHPTEHLRGTIYVDGTLTISQSVDIGGPSGDATLAVAGDLVIPDGIKLTNRHDLTTVSGRRTPGVVVLGSQAAAGSSSVCGSVSVTGSGRLVMCAGSRIVVDGLVYTQDGMTIRPRASVDQVGAMYHGSGGTPNSSFRTEDASVVLRFDPLALSVFRKGISILSWQQLH